jgi:SAM-dependent methyltransferase
MGYRLCLVGQQNALEWSQAVWKGDGRTVPIHYCRQELVHDRLLQHLPKDGLIVDAGSGTGKWPIYLHRLGFRIVGVEISHEANVIAKENQGDVALIEADLMAMPLRDRSIDAVLSFGVVEHNEAGPLEALRETHRILKPDGLLVLSVPYNNLFRRVLVNHVHRYLTWKRRRAHAEMRFAEYRFTRREMRDFLESSGFQVVAVYPNDMLPPNNVGLWVDDNSIFGDPLSLAPVELFVLHGLKGAIAQRMMRWFPWCVCGEITFIACPK